MNQRVLAFAAACLLLSPVLFAQNSVTVEALEYAKKDSLLRLSFDANLAGLDLPSNNLLIVTPEIRNNAGGDTLALTPFVVAGKTRMKVLEREALLGNRSAFVTDAAPRSLTLRQKGMPQSVDYSIETPYADWMADAALVLRLTETGCPGCKPADVELPLVARLFEEVKEPYRPTWKIAYVVPEAEPVKVRSDKYAATIGFQVGKTNIVESLFNNQAVLDEVNEKVVAIVKNPDLKTSKVEIVGYASPEGSVASNKRLGDGRAAAFADFLSERYGISRSAFTASGYGEDWVRARELVEKGAGALTESARQKVLAIIDEVSNPDARDARIRAIDGGKSYKELLRNVWPQIRRTEYSLSYSVRAFNVEEAKAMLRTNPKLLSLNEMYLVAETYDPASKEFKEVFDIAARLFPDEPVARINAAAADLEIGNYFTAQKALPGLREPAALNNLAVAAALAGDLAAAETLFNQAAAAGSPDAAHNLSELAKMKE